MNKLANTGLAGGRDEPNDADEFVERLVDVHADLCARLDVTDGELLRQLHALLGGDLANTHVARHSRVPRLCDVTNLSTRWRRGDTSALVRYTWYC